MAAGPRVTWDETGRGLTLAVHGEANPVLAGVIAALVREGAIGTRSRRLPDLISSATGCAWTALSRRA